MQTDVRIKQGIEQMFVYNNIEKLNGSIGGSAMVAITGREPREQIFRRDLRLIDGYGNVHHPSQLKVLASLRTVLIVGSFSILILLSYSLGISKTLSATHSSANDGRPIGASAVNYIVRNGDTAQSIAIAVGSNSSQSKFIAKEIESVEGSGSLAPGTVLHILR